MSGTSGGATGNYSLRYLKRPDVNPATYISSPLSAVVNVPGVNQFDTQSAFTNTNIAKGAEAGFGVKNGSLTTGGLHDQAYSL